MTVLIKKKYLNNIKILKIAIIFWVIFRKKIRVKINCRIFNKPKMYLNNMETIWKKEEIL